ncbi:MAG: c-type cytochrome [Anaerolineae bacterium]|nr:c-type cytochrome [Anaerolineae bacterium]
MLRLAKFTTGGVFPLIFMVIIAISACTGLSGEPEVVSTLRPRATLAPTEPIVFQMPENIDVALGAEIFADRCTACHGVGGAGDGETASQLPVRPMNFTDPEAVRGKTPQEWFQAIYFGNQVALMPAYGVPSQVSATAPLNEEQIWAVTMFLFTLSGSDVAQPITTPGADATEFVEPTALPDATTEISVSPDTTQDVASLEPVTTPEAEGTASAEATILGEGGLVTGAVINGTAGGIVPPDLPVTLYASGMTGDTMVAETTLSADGTFQFENITMSHGEEFYATVEYLGGFFVSEILTPASGTNTLALPITIYELTYDPQAIRVTNVLTYANVLDNTMLDIVQVIEFANITDKLYVQVVDEVVSALMIGLPEGAIFNDVTGGRFRVSEDGRTVTDTRPVFPQSAQTSAHTLHFAYTVPYDGDVTLEQTFPYLVEGELDVLIQQKGISVDGDGFQSRGSRMIAEGVFSDFGATLSLMPQTPIVFSVRGTVEIEPEQTASAPNMPIAIALVGAGVLSIALAGFIYVKDRRDSAGEVISSPDVKAEINLLMKQIAELDIQHQEGKMPEGEYQKKRDTLKSRLTKLMKHQKS